ncbi:high-affinity iron transporter [Mariprofundus aestuarium]|uniref:High-affinity iron transporter n=1 Tax=Mariprofundus aestuarium TaxID=1921086 RepID=A0A2K8KZX0_MARES|nr:FTR1 family protein [Mariprofundus aestuarium]ATX80493.1 high-affinity iron transporter [Mariprofundus aestuarium]
MIASLVIVFREMLEMVLVVGVLMAATQGVPGSRKWIGIGVFGGLMGAGFFGLFMEQMEASFEGEGEFIFNAVILLLASLLIAWTVFWMSSHGREMSQRMRLAGVSVKGGELPYAALAVVALSAVMREGSEAVFFLFGAAQSIHEDGWSMLIGGLMGAGSALVIGSLVYLGLVRIPVKQLFSVAGWLLMLLAAGMASQATWNLVVIGWLPALVDPLWNSSSILSSSSMYGELLHVLVGYDDQPSALQVIVFAVSLMVMVTLKQRLQPQKMETVRA